MNRNDALNYIHENPDIYLQKDGSKKGYICPICGSGAGHKGTGITTKDGIHFTCWAQNCFTNADIVDIIGQGYGISEPAEKFKKAYEVYGLNIDDDYKVNIKAAVDEFEFVETPGHEVPREALDYLKSRGIQEKTANKFNIKYEPKGSLSGGPAILFPTGGNSYISRAITDEGNRYKNIGPSKLFNEEALSGVDPVFIVEGIIDALSIIEAGGNAVSLNSTSNYTKLIEKAKKGEIKAPLIIVLDNDSPGYETSKKLDQGLKELNITPYTSLDFYGKYKDANEMLKNERAFLTVQIEKVVVEVGEELEGLRRAEEEEAREAYFQNSAYSHIANFIDGIHENAETSAIPTGFKKLDAALDGGLYEGLYIIGAVSSLGKTTLALQIGDQIAADGQDVLIISMEMARSELMAKSISRNTIINVIESKSRTEYAKTNRGITAGQRYHFYSEKEIKLINKSINDYAEIAKHVYIYEGIGNIGADKIRQLVKQHTEYTGKAPVVIIDYIQILAPHNDRASDKQNTDKSVLELKRISRDFKIPVIGISSLNRANYKTTIDMEAFKESGAIEYGSDVLLGLQFTRSEKKDEKGKPKDIDLTEAKKKDPREIELVVLKNRNYKTGLKVYFKYYTMFNYFQEDEGYTIDYDATI